MSDWTTCPCDPQRFLYSLAELESRWAHLHAGDAEPWPGEVAIQQAWALYHAGAFQAATRAGLQAGAGGLAVALRAQTVYASHLEPREAGRLDLLLEVVGRARQLTLDEPARANAWYALAHALGRYCQGVTVPKALTQGLGQQVRLALEAAIRCEPRHAHAQVALGLYHAELIDKLGKLRALAQGADAAVGLQLLRKGLKFQPDNPGTLMEVARGLVMLEGARALAEAEGLFQQAAACVPEDAIEWLEVDMARAELAG